MPRLERVLKEGDVRPYTRYREIPYERPDPRPPKPLEPPGGSDPEKGEWQFLDDRDIGGSLDTGVWEWWPKGAIDVIEENRRLRHEQFHNWADQSRQDPIYQLLFQKWRDPTISRDDYKQIWRQLRSHVYKFVWQQLETKDLK